MEKVQYGDFVEVRTGFFAEYRGIAMGRGIEVYLVGDNKSIIEPMENLEIIEKAKRKRS